MSLPSLCQAAVSPLHSPRRFTVRAGSLEQVDLRRPPASLYEVLRVKHTASPTEIKTAYRTLAKMCHPYASESDGRDFIEIHNAYATLSDPAARAVYDLSPRRSSYQTDQCW